MSVSSEITSLMYIDAHRYAENGAMSFSAGPEIVLMTSVGFQGHDVVANKTKQNKTKQKKRKKKKKKTSVDLTKKRLNKVDNYNAYNGYAISI